MGVKGGPEGVGGKGKCCAGSLACACHVSNSIPLSSEICTPSNKYTLAGLQETYSIFWTWLAFIFLQTSPRAASPCTSSSASSPRPRRACPIPLARKAFPSSVMSLTSRPRALRSGCTGASTRTSTAPVSSVTVLGQTIIIINDYESAIELLEKRSTIYSDRLSFVFCSEMSVSSTVSSCA